MSAEAPIESVVLCEGYHDRAFWAGLLLSRCGCVKSTRDPFGETVQGAGQYGFCTLSGQFARVVPAGGDADRVLQAGRTRLGRRRSKPLRRLVLCIDDDTLGGDGSPRLSAQ